MVSVAASVLWPSAARPRRSASPCRAQRAAHPLRRCVCARASASSTGEGAASGTGEGGRTLDAAAATFALLRAELPYVGPAVAAKVADRVAYSYAGGLHSCRGKEAYLSLHQHWRKQVPDKLGTSWKWTCTRTFQPDPSTLVVRWQVKWLMQPPGWSLLGMTWDDEDVEEGVEEERVSVTVAALAQRLEAAEEAVVRATASLPPAAEASGAALELALNSLRAGLQLSRTLQTEVEAAEAEDAAGEGALGWGGGGTVQEEAAYKARMASLREALTSRVNGTTTLVLDAEGRVVSHVDTLDFPSAMEIAPVDGSSPQLSSEVLEPASQGDSDFLWCLAHQVPGQGGLGWRLCVVRQLLWEGFVRDSSVDDEVRMSLPREEFDELVTAVLFATTFATAALAAYCAFWVVFVAPELPAQLAAATQAAGGGAAAPQLPSLAQLVQQVGSALRGPSLFS